MAVTIGNIAESAGVDASAVSRVLSGKARQYRISADAERRVLEAARKLKYRPNAAAKATATGRFGCAALLQSTSGGRSTLPQQLVAGLCGGLAERQMYLSIACLPDADLTSEQVVPDILRMWFADGLLINYTDHIPEKMVRLIREYRIPSIWINAPLEADCIHPDDFNAAALATRELIGLGHRRIDYLDLAHGEASLAGDHYSARDREAGYAHAMREAGLPPRTHRSAEHLPPEQRLPMLHAVLDRPDRPTAMIGYGPRESQAMFIACLERRWRSGRELSHVHFEDVRSESGHPATRFVATAASACVIDQEQLGRSAIDLLTRKIAEPDRPLDPVALPFTFARGETIGSPVTQGESPG